MCHHFIINVSATFCWLDTDHQKTFSKAVCTYLSTNCHVYVLRARARAGRSDTAGWMTEPDLIRSDSDLDIPVFRYPFYYLQNKIKITKVCSPMRCNTRANATRPKRAPAVSRIVKVSYVIRSAFIFFFFFFCFKDLENPSDLTILIESLLTSLNMSISR